MSIAIVGVVVWWKEIVGARVGVVGGLIWGESIVDGVTVQSKESVNLCYLSSPRVN